MIIAIPMSRDRLATHFTKAPEIAFYDEHQQLINRVANPAVAGGCSAKKAMLNMIIEHNADIVIVQFIGERMLGKLLDAGVSVSQADNSLSIAELMTNAKDLNCRLVEASQGRRSINHEKKGGCCGGSSGGCGCGCGGAKTTSSILEPRLLHVPQHVSVGKDSSGKAISPVMYAGFRSVK
ncbi:NifB/NifX family molybdenum-iron cluster-binding protein [Shewanella pneumatophori]|uniref:Dinitrogenase iron-molybdenum cofactor biosynthesis protein n=1 Tax=Shewanella pneumatophori TaxID=314092 RepID=A0A9X1ZGE6_9GAMM|nr:NifB/NifX family molybdenum-iron cluster-binding protein [Shewanella pneumatophori]MCL1139425.1 dinitrogenase iron-molybdenum cofactor biosynthesis protein [Shewanella pneumatophori]